MTKSKNILWIWPDSFDNIAFGFDPRKCNKANMV